MLNRLLAWLLAATLAVLPVQAHAVSDVWDYDATTPANNTNVGGVSMAEGMLPGLLNDGIREMLAQLKRAVANQGSDITSVGGAPAICATGTSAYVKVTGTTTVTSFGTAAAGCSRWVTFTGALQITHNATSMILPGGVNYTTAAGDMIWAVSEGSGNWRVRIFPAAGTSPVANSNGVHKLWIGAAGLLGYPAASPAFTEQVATAYPYASWDFDAASIEAVYFTLGMPSSWNEGTVTFVPVWTASSGSGDVIWSLLCVARGNDDAIASAAGASVTSTDTLIATGDLHRGPQSSALTIDGTPAANDVIFCFFRRVANDGGDTFNADAKLIGIEFYLTTDAATDAP